MFNKILESNMDSDYFRFLCDQNIDTLNERHLLVFYTNDPDDIRYFFNKNKIEIHKITNEFNHFNQEGITFNSLEAFKEYEVAFKNNEKFRDLALEVLDNTQNEFLKKYLVNKYGNDLLALKNSGYAIDYVLINNFNFFTEEQKKQIETGVSSLKIISKISDLKGKKKEQYEKLCENFIQYLSFKKEYSPSVEITNTVDKLLSQSSPKTEDKTQDLLYKINLLKKEGLFDFNSVKEWINNTNIQFSNANDTYFKDIIRNYFIEDLVNNYESLPPVIIYDFLEDIIKINGIEVLFKERNNSDKSLFCHYLDKMKNTEGLINPLLGRDINSYIGEKELISLLRHTQLAIFCLKNNIIELNEARKRIIYDFHKDVIEYRGLFSSIFSDIEKENITKHLEGENFVPTNKKRL